jgi:phenylpyruvate tautomerase PptA (4-oxalocrotonate tautomerase family)
VPILDIELVGPIDGVSADGLAARLADATAAVLDPDRPRGTWVRVRHLSRDDYAENAGGPVEGTLPVFVSVLMAAPPDAEQLEHEVHALTEAVADACGRSAEHVHVLYEPAAAGRIAFGGALRR